MTREELFGLIVHPESYVSVEPHVDSMQWLDAGELRPGSRARIVTSIPFRVSAVRRVIGPVEGLLTLSDWNPPSGLACRFESSRLVGVLNVEVRQARATEVHLRGTLLPRPRYLWYVLRPMKSHLEMLMVRSVDRGAARFESHAKKLSAS